MSKLQKKFRTQIVPKLKEEMKLSNDLAVPKLIKVVVNVGAGQALQDSKFLEGVAANLALITGQKPIMTKAKKSISNFKIRAGMIIGAKVTLRGKRMYDFVDKLVNIALPRVRDFRGIEMSGFDGNGNYTVGIKELNVFPEVNPVEVIKSHGMDISIITSAKDDKAAEKLLRYLGFPLQEKKNA